MKLTFLTLILIQIIAYRSIAIASYLKCKNVFLKPSSTLSFVSPRGEGPGPRESLPIEYDSRFFQMQLIKASSKSEYRDPMEVKNFSNMAHKYEYLKTLYHRNGTHFIFRSADGIEFTVPMRNYFEVSNQNITGNNIDKNIESVLNYLDRVLELVKSKKINRDLDSYFSRLYNHQQATYSGYGSETTTRRKEESTSSEYYVGRIPDTSFKKVFVKSVRQAENLVVERYDTELRFEEVDNINNKSYPNRSFQLKILDEVLNFTFALYSERRGWSPSFLNSLREKALNQIDMTTIIIVREKGVDNQPGKIIATMSLNRAPYGKVQFFDTLAQQWKEMYGSFGGLAFSKFGSGTGKIWGHSDAIELWGSDVPILSLEQYFGRGAILPRPTVVERAIGPSLDTDLKTDAWFVDGRDHITAKGV